VLLKKPKSNGSVRKKSAEPSKKRRRRGPKKRRRGSPRNEGLERKLIALNVRKQHVNKCNVRKRLPHGEPHAKDLVQNDKIRSLDPERHYQWTPGPTPKKAALRPVYTWPASLVVAGVNDKLQGKPQSPRARVPLVHRNLQLPLPLPKNLLHLAAPVGMFPPTCAKAPVVEAARHHPAIYRLETSRPLLLMAPVEVDMRPHT